MGWDSTYTAGTISIGSGAVVAVGSGTMWSVLSDQANLLILPTYGLATLVNGVTDDTHLAIPQWGTTVIAGAPYILVQFPLASLLASRQLRDALAKLTGIGVIYYVTGAAPDDEIGDDGDFAIKINSGPFKIWTKITGHWTLQGSPVGTNWKGAWAAPTSYAIGDTARFTDGNVYIAIQPGAGHQPDISPTYWELYLGNGDRYDIAIYDTDRPASGEQIAKWIAPSQTTFLSGLALSRAKADAGATGSSVFTLYKNGVSFATLTFNAASAIGVFACATTTVFAAGDVLTIIAPNPRDATLSGVAGTIVAFRG